MSMYSVGAIILHRKLVEWQWYQDINVKTVFLHLLLIVNWRTKRWKKLIIERGQKLTSYGKLAEETGLTPKQVRRAIDKLKVTGEIITSRAANGLLISVVNYDAYQLIPKYNGLSGGGDRAVSRQLMNKSNNDNNSDISELPVKLLDVLSAGGWDEPAEIVGRWVVEYGVDWIEEAFTRSVSNCGSNPPLRYVQRVLENFKRNGGLGNGAGQSYKKAAGRAQGKERAKGKFCSHPAGRS